MAPLNYYPWFPGALRMTAGLLAFVLMAVCSFVETKVFEMWV